MGSSECGSLPLKVSWVHSESDVPAGLWERCFPPPFEGQWWYHALEHCGLEEQFIFLYAVVFDQAGPVAIAPAFLMDVPIEIVLPPALLPIAKIVGHIVPSALYQKTFFIGSPCSDEGMVGMLPGTNHLAVYRCVNKAMQVKADELKASMRVWKDFPPSSDGDFSTLQKSDRLFRLVSFPGTNIRFSGVTKEDYLASLKASRRNKLKKKLKLAGSSPIDVEMVHQPDALLLDEIFSLFCQTYDKSKTRFEKLNLKFFEIIGRNPFAHFIVLRERQAGSVVAFMLCFILGDHVINKFIGIDYRKPKEWFLYFRLWDAVVDWSLSQGAKSIQSGQTGYAPKIEIGNELVPLTNYCAHSNSFVQAIYACVAKMVNWETLDADLAVYLEAYPQLRPRGKEG